jgi:hypothetical protein
MWSCGYDSGDDLLGTSEEVEIACGWSGRRGALTPILEEIGWIDVTPEGYRIHDLMDHAPDYVRKRFDREFKRGQRPVTDRSVTGQRPDADRPLTPTPAPAPAPAPALPPIAPRGGAPPGSRKRPPGDVGEEGYSQEFNRFWTVYPRRVGKAAAWRAWRQLAARRPPIEAILAAVDRASATEQWQRDGGQFVPHPATWLRRGGWDDELEEPASKPNPELDEFARLVIGTKATEVAP